MTESTRSKMPAPEGTPGPRNPEPLPASNAAGFVAVPSDEDEVAGSVGDDPHPPASGEAGSGSAATSHGRDTARKPA